MLIALALIALAILFYLLAISADIVVVSLRKLGKELGIRIYFLGFILGMFTSAPEMMIGLDTAVRGISTLALGNLMGGIIVVLGLVLGASVMLNRSVATPSQRPPLGMIVLFLALPLALGFDGALSRAEGMTLVILYLALLYFIYRTGGSHETAPKPTAGGRRSLQHLFFVLAGLVALIALSDAILRITEFVLAHFGVSLFFVGMLVYAFGTNLPEIMVVLRAWRNHTRELSLSSLLGSAMANVFVIGVVIFLAPVAVSINNAYLSLAAVCGALFMAVLAFSRTGRRMVRAEGAALALIYLIFVFSQLWIEFF